ncbi:MAG: 50S ribosomal protein L6 [Nitrososphaerales archaeon]
MSTKEGKISKKNQMLSVSVEFPEGVDASFTNNELTVSGPLGRVKQNFSKMPVDLRIQGRTVEVSTHGARRTNRAMINTARSHVQNSIDGVTKGYQYKLKVVFAHFPVTVKVQGSNVLVENFYGERSPRVAKIVGDTKVEVQSEDITLTGVSVEDVGQTAANLEQATTVKRKDQRVFLDGVYIYERVRKGAE